MAIKLLTTVSHIDSFSRDEWVAEGGDPNDYNALLIAQLNEEKVEIVSLETENYYNVRVGHRVVTGLSHYHLDGIEHDTPLAFINLDELLTCGHY